MKFCYKNENIISTILACLLASIAFVAFAVLYVSTTIKDETQQYVNIMLVVSVFVACIFVIWCGIFVGSKAINFRKWHKRLVGEGRKSTGRIKEIISDRNIDTNRKEYRFKVEYTSSFTNRVEEFTTPVLNFTPNIKKEYECDVYEVGAPEHNTEVDMYDFGNKLIVIRGMHITFNISPIKLFKESFKMESSKDFGNVVADAFRVVKY